MKKTKQTEQREIGRIKLSDTQDLVVSIVDDQKLDLRVFLNTDSYKGPTKRGIRFYFFDDNWPEFLIFSMKNELNGKLSMILGLWTIIFCILFPFPMTLIVVIIILFGLAEYFAEEEKKRSISFIEEEELPPPISEPKKKTKSKLSEKRRSKTKDDSI